MPRSANWRTEKARRALTRAAAVGLAVALTGCATVPTLLGPPSGLREEMPYLVDPLLGFPGEVSPAARERLRSVHADLRAGRVDEVRAQLEPLSRATPLTAAVLAAELDLIERRYAPAAETLRAVVAELPEYVAARLVLARAEEQLGRLIEAYAGYRATSAVVPVARDQMEALEPRVLTVLGRRVEEQLAQGQVAEAESTLRRLESWAGGQEVALQAARRVAQAQQDPRRELAAVRGLAALRNEDEEVRRRLAELEVGWGDAGTGLRLYEELAAAYPDDLEIAERIESARYAFRLSLLPPNVRELTDRPALARGEFAALVYWLMPSVRAARGVGRIASDVLESPYRREIVRILNLGLIGMDSARHLFYPERPVYRHDALLGFLRVAASEARSAACLAGARLEDVRSPEAVCALAARCGLAGEPADCLPSAPVSGHETVEMARRTLNLAGD